MSLSGAPPPPPPPPSAADLSKAFKKPLVLNENKNEEKQKVVKANVPVPVAASNIKGIDANELMAAVNKRKIKAEQMVQQQIQTPKIETQLEETKKQEFISKPLKKVDQPPSKTEQNQQDNQYKGVSAELAEKFKKRRTLIEQQEQELKAFQNKQQYPNQQPNNDTNTNINKITSNIDVKNKNNNSSNNLINYEKLINEKIEFLKQTINEVSKTFKFEICLDLRTSLEKLESLLKNQSGQGVNEDQYRKIIAEIDNKIELHNI